MPDLNASSSLAPYAALGLLSSATTSVPRRIKLREVNSRFENYKRTLVVRFLVAMPAGRSSHSAEIVTESHAKSDILLLNESESPFRCGLKYARWFAWALTHFPTAAYLATGDDDAYIQLAHLEADLRLVAQAVGDAPVLWGLTMWRAYYNNRTFDTSTGFMGFTQSDGMAVRVRRSMEACEQQLVAQPLLRGELLAIATRNGSLRQDTRAPACSSLAANPKRALAVLRSQVDWDLPPWPMVNGPLFAISRALGRALAADLERAAPLTTRTAAPPQPYTQASHKPPQQQPEQQKLPLSSMEWVTQLESTPLGRAYFASRRPKAEGAPKAKAPSELAKRACWPNGDAVLGLWAVQAAVRRSMPVTLVNTPAHVQHYPYPVYSHRAFSNRSIVLHGAKRPASRLWDFAQRRGEGPFVPYHRECGGCADMGWVSYRPSVFADWQCCGSKVENGDNARGRGGHRAAPTDAAVVKPKGGAASTRKAKGERRAALRDTRAAAKDAERMNRRSAAAEDRAAEKPSAVEAPPRKRAARGGAGAGGSAGSGTTSAASEASVQASDATLLERVQLLEAKVAAATQRLEALS